MWGISITLMLLHWQVPPTWLPFSISLPVPSSDIFHSPPFCPPIILFWTNSLIHKIAFLLSWLNLSLLLSYFYFFLSLMGHLKKKKSKTSERMKMERIKHILVHGSMATRKKYDSSLIFSTHLFCTVMTCRNIIIFCHENLHLPFYLVPPHFPI